MEKPLNEKRSVDLVVKKLNKINDAGEVVEAMDLSTLPNSDSDFITDIKNELSNIQTLLNTVNERLNSLTNSN